MQVQHDGHPGSPDEPGTPGWELFFAPQPGDLLVHKDVGDAFAANPDLAGTLKDREAERSLATAGIQVTPAATIHF